MNAPTTPGLYVPHVSLRQTLEGVRRVVLTAHLDPDPDGVGCMLGLYHALSQEGWEAVPVCIGQIPSFAPTLPGSDRLVAFPSRLDSADSLPPAMLAPGDAVVVCDTPSRERMGAFFERHEEVLADCQLIVFDHHITNEGYGTINYVDPTAAATAEVVGDVLDASDIPIGRDAAWGLMTALIGDTQCFRTESTSARSLLWGYRLAALGAPIYPIAELLFKTRPLSSMRLWGAALHSARSADGVAWTAITEEMLQETGATMEDIEGVVDFLLATVGTRVAFVLKEHRAYGETKVSMRTVPGVDATRIVGVFGGGGHARAAGCTILGRTEEAEAQLLPLVLNELALAPAV